MRNLAVFGLAILLSGALWACKSENQQNAGAQDEKKKKEKKTQKQEQAETTSPTLENLWKTDSVFKIPESVYYDDARNLLYVANIQGESNAKDGNGFISRVDLDGEILDRKWITGLNAPKGMGVHNNKLYVSDVDAVVRIHLGKEEIEKRFPLKGAEFANDIDINQEGTVYISDMRGNKIYGLKDDKTSVWLDSDKLDGPNGLYAEENALLIGINGSVLKADYETGQLEELIANTGGIDGLEHVEGDKYIISDWAGHVHLIQPGKEKILLLNTADQDINAADFDFNKKEKKLYIPTFFDNRVTAYQLKL